MAKSTSGKPSPEKPIPILNLIKRLARSPWRLLRMLGAAAALAVIIFLHPIILEIIGFAAIMGLVWAGTLAALAWRRQTGSLLKWWNFWLGSVVLTLAVWGVLAVFYPSDFAISGVEFDEVSLGGKAGAYIVGNEGASALAALRLAAIFLVGVGIIIPYPSFRFLQGLARAGNTAISSAASGAIWLLLKVARRLVRFYRRQPLHRKLAAGIMALLRWIRPQRAAGTAEMALPAPEEAEAAPTGTTGIQLPLEPAPGTHEAAAGQVPEPESETAPLHHSPSATQGLPSIELLDQAAEVTFSSADNEQRAKLIEESLSSYGVNAKVVQINPGPSVTQFGIEPGWDVKHRRIVERDQQGKVKLDNDGNPIERMQEVSRTRVKVERITALSNNLALALATPNIRIEAPVPGKPVVGIEVPNTTTTVVRLREVMESTAFQKVRARSKLALALGNGAAGEPAAADLTKMPHLLIAGTTGSGKTVCINSIITCLLICNSPEDMRLLLIDPKRVELVSFNGVPHLISPVVVEVDKAIETLRRVIREMDTRFSKFAAVGVRNIEGYNRSPLVADRMPYLVVIVDELADLMMSAAEVVEPAICRLAQLSRATGIHLILATQRPSVDVVTGLIKANFPTRASFAVASAVDSRTILDIGGAEKLLGQGDMLYVPSDANKPRRLRGCFVSDQEIDNVVAFWKRQLGEQTLQAEDAVAQAFACLESDEVKSEDTLLPTARRLAREHSHLSTSLLQRRLHIGYPRAARIMDSLEEEGTVIRGPDGGVGEIPERDGEEAE